MRAEEAHGGSEGKKLELKAWLGALEAVKVLETRKDVTLPALIHEMAVAHGERPALIGERDRLSYAHLSARLKRYANWAQSKGLGAGDTICLLMPNCPEYPAIWLGLTQAGCAVALLNTTLDGDALAHCITAAASKNLIFSKAFLPVIEAAKGRLPATMQYWLDGAADSQTWLQRMELESDAPEQTRVPHTPSARDVALLIYTSGTTGLPKAARLTHGRLIEWSFWFAGMWEAGPADRVYNCLPAYHSTGGIVAIGAMLVRGGAVVMRARFSARRFWDDIVAEKCTIFIYIGELCRYLIQDKVADRAVGHQLRLCSGNGLGREVWEKFQARFAIPRIIEFYAATEGSVSLYNCAGKPGAIGHVPGFLRHNFPVTLVKLDAEAGDVLRGEDGLCRICGPGEAGEALGRIAGGSHMPSRQFDGYTDDAASARKILRDVRAEGDAWFRTGDLMRQDEMGFYYFVERLGDTFRWKGENVSTEEVANVLRACGGVQEAIVFGVAIPGFEGRAGMAAITTASGFCSNTLLAHVERHLPDYARPVFIRICASLDLTGTFKYRKERFVREGFLSAAHADAVWYYDRQARQFINCDETLRQEFVSGTLSRL